MSCLRWVCRWNAPVPPSVSHLASGQLRKKSPMLAMRLTESRSESKTPANMPSLRQLEFAFEQFAIRVVERHDTVVGQALRLPARQKATEAVTLQLGGRSAALETEARQLLCSLGAKRIAIELRV